ncbi:MAG: RNA polymerase sigma factor for flagellar operon FliA [Planctomycetota bacterium]|jgi:RNA polymerase sigma factor for flagellar operon FliA
MAARKAKKTTKKVQKKASAKSKATSAKKTTKKAAAKKAATKKKAVAKKAATKKPAIKKPAPRKAASKKATPKKDAANKSATKKTAAKKATLKKTTTKGSSGKKATPKKAAPKRTATKTAAKKPVTQAAKKATPVRKITAVKAAKAPKKSSPAPRFTSAPKTPAVTSTATTINAPEATSETAPTKEKVAANATPSIADTPTEELWILYRKEASEGGRKNNRALDNLRNILIERHHPLVKYIAERLLQTLPKSIELDDLISAGNFGLMDAIRGFDPYRGIKFKTYCSTRVRGAILDQLRSQDWVPRLVRLKASRIDKALQRLTAEYGREPTHAELAKTLEMEHGELSKEIQEARAKTMFSLSEKWEDDDGSVEKVEVLEDKSAVDPVGELNRRDLMSFITRALTHKERFIIEQYYQYGHTMREIGEMLALTESRVCQIHSNVMSRLKGLLGQRAGVLMGN